MLKWVRKLPMAVHVHSITMQHKDMYVHMDIHVQLTHMHVYVCTLSVVVFIIQ